jgi:ABC-type multidrug transport system fused ATPase/permease subunit
VILLESPCDHLSETQERTFFQLLRGEMKGSGSRSGKVVILTASRFATAIHADKVIVMVDGRVGQEGTYKELVSKPGPFRDQLFPPV